MKVLYIAPYRTGTDYTDAACNYIQALDSIGVDVVPRCVHDNLVDVSDKIKELEKKSSEGCDTLIIHGPPPHFEHHSKFRKCIGITHVETNQFVNSTWANKMNLMDKIVVANQVAKTACIDSYVDEKKIVVLPYAFNMDTYQKSHKPLEEIKSLANGDFLFYMISRSNKRKNIVEVLRAFHSEFRPEESVNIVVKTGAPNLPPQISREEMKKICDAVKRDLRLYPRASSYKEEIIITEWLSKEDLMSLHNTCHSYIAVSSNENWCIPAFDAMAFGNVPIAIRYAGQAEYFNDSNSFCVSHELENCFGSVGASEIYTADEQWAVPNISHLRKQMRKAYNLSQNKQKLVDNGLEQAYNFSYDIVGNKLKELLLDEQQK